MNNTLYPSGTILKVILLATECKVEVLYSTSCDNWMGNQYLVRYVEKTKKVTLDGQKYTIKNNSSFHINQMAITSVVSTNTINK